MEKINPTVSMSDIEGLSWATRKKIVDEEPCVITKFTFTAEPTADALRTLHHLLKNGKGLTVTFRSPSLQMEMDLQGIQQEKADQGEGTEPV